MFIGLLIYNNKVKVENVSVHYLIQEFLDKLEKIEGFTYIVTCLYRDPSTNARVVGVHNSKHMLNPVQAVDIAYFSKEQVKNSNKYRELLERNTTELKRIRGIFFEKLKKTRQRIEDAEKKIEDEKTELDSILDEEYLKFRQLLEEAVKDTKDEKNSLKLVLVDEGEKVLNDKAMPHYHIEVKKMGEGKKSSSPSSNSSKVSSGRTKDSNLQSDIPKYVEAEDIVMLEDSGYLDIPFAYIHLRDKSVYKIRVPVFRVGLSILEIVCRILSKYGYEVHVSVDVAKNNLLPFKLNLELMKFISSSKQKGNVAGDKSDIEVSEKSGAGYIEFGTRLSDGSVLKNIIEVDDNDTVYFTDPNFCHFNTNLTAVKKKVSELFPQISTRNNEDQKLFYIYKKRPPESEDTKDKQGKSSYVDSLFVTNFPLEETDLFKNNPSPPFVRLSGEDEVVVSFSPKVFRKDMENDIDFCTKICASVGCSLVTAIKSVRVDIIDYVRSLQQYEPVVFVLPRPNKPLYVSSYKRPVIDSTQTEETDVYPFSVDLFNKVMEQYVEYKKSEGKQKLSQISLPVWNFSANIDLNSMGQGFIESKYLNQNVFLSKIFVLKAPPGLSKSGISSNAPASTSLPNPEGIQFRINAKDPDTLLMAETFFKNPKLVEKLFADNDFYKRIIASNFTEVQHNERDSSLPKLEVNAINWSVSFTTFGIPFFQPGGCYELLNFLPDFFYKTIAFTPETELERERWRWRWRCVEVIHNFGYPYTMQVTLSV